MGAAPRRETVQELTPATARLGDASSCQQKSVRAMGNSVDGIFSGFTGRSPPPRTLQGALRSGGQNGLAQPEIPSAVRARGCRHAVDAAARRVHRALQPALLVTGLGASRRDGAGHSPREALPRPRSTPSSSPSTGAAGCSSTAGNRIIPMAPLPTASRKRNGAAADRRYPRHLSQAPDGRPRRVEFAGTVAGGVAQHHLALNVTGRRPVAGHSEGSGSRGHMVPMSNRPHALAVHRAPAVPRLAHFEPASRFGHGRPRVSAALPNNGTWRGGATGVEAQLRSAFRRVLLIGRFGRERHAGALAGEQRAPPRLVLQMLLHAERRLARLRRRRS